MTKTGKMITIFFIIMIAVFLFFFGYSTKQITSKKAVHGVLDLTDHQFIEDGMVPLNGQWEFYWN